MLLHPTSLPGEDLGATAREMVDFLAAAGQSWWQMLPVGPTGYGNSPYSAQSAFAGNPALVSTDRLIADGLLREKERHLPPDERLRAAFAAFGDGSGHPNLALFVGETRDWLEEFALYRALKRDNGERQWTRWPAPLRDRDAAAVDRAREALASEIAFTRFVQWRFFGDWQALREYAHARGIGLIGDLPIFLAHDSADVWLNRHQFYLDDAGEPTLVAGVPPDYFSATGQRWGNPLYRWAEMRAHRVSPGGSRASARRWRCSTPSASITSSASRATGRSRRREPTAVKGRWRPGPGARFFRAVAAALGELPLIAEDLGAVTPEVESLRDAVRVPGDQAPAVRVRDRSAGAQLPAAQLPARGGRLHRHARQRHHRRMVPRPRQRHARPRTVGAGATGGAPLPGRARR